MFSIISLELIDSCSTLWLILTLFMMCCPITMLYIGTPDNLSVLTFMGYFRLAKFLAEDQSPNLQTSISLQNILVQVGPPPAPTRQSWHSWKFLELLGRAVAQRLEHQTLREPWIESYASVSNLLASSFSSHCSSSPSFL